MADLRARRLELTRASLRERLVQGDLDDVRVVVESLAEEFDILDVAAAAVQLRTRRWGETATTTFPCRRRRQPPRNAGRGPNRRSRHAAGP